MQFDVIVQEGSQRTHHHVTMTPAHYQQLTGGRVSPVRCVEAAFRFLLDHEPKESILGAFDITVIAKYFPLFQQDIRRYL